MLTPVPLEHPEETPPAVQPDAPRPGSRVPALPSTAAPEPDLGVAKTTNQTQSPIIQASGTTKRKRSQIHTIVIKSGTTYNVSIYGNKFQVIQSRLARCRSIRYDPSASFSVYGVGVGVEMDTEAAFTILEIQNPLTFPITVIIGFGWDNHKSYIAPAYRVPVFEGYAAFAGGVAQTFATANATLFQDGVQVLTGVPIGHLYFRYGFFYGYQVPLATGTNPTANAAAANIGATGFLLDALPQGGWTQYSAPAGELWDLFNFNFLGTAGTDGVVFRLLQ